VSGYRACKVCKPDQCSGDRSVMELSDRQELLNTQSQRDFSGLKAAFLVAAPLRSLPINPSGMLCTVHDFPRAYEP
jgi:hypothetical protein